MAEKNEKADIDFNEALRRIANAPKSAVLDKGLIMPDKVGYNKANGAAGKPPQPAKRRR